MPSINQAASIAFTKTTLEQIDFNPAQRFSLSLSKKFLEWLKQSSVSFFQYSIHTGSFVKPNEFILTKETLRPLFVSSSERTWGRVALIVVGLASLVLGCLFAAATKLSHKDWKAEENPAKKEQFYGQMNTGIVLTTIFLTIGVAAISGAWILKRRAFNQATHLITLLDTQGVASAIKVVQERGAVESLLGDLIKKTFKSQHPTGGHLFNGNKHFAYVK